MSINQKPKRRLSPILFVFIAFVGVLSYQLFFSSEAKSAARDAAAREYEMSQRPKPSVALSISRSELEMRNTGGNLLKGEMELVLDGTYRLREYRDIAPGKRAVFDLNDFADEDGNRFNPFRKKAKQVTVSIERYQPLAYNVP
jgi:hypothetical protein